MPKKSRLKWFGKRAERDLAKAAKIGVNVTMGQGVSLSKVSHPWKNRTGTAERSLRIASAAKKVGQFVEGIWGSVNVIYFKFLEPRFPTLLPVRDTIDPKLSGNITEAYLRIVLKRTGTSIG